MLKKLKFLAILLAFFVSLNCLTSPVKASSSTDTIDAIATRASMLVSVSLSILNSGELYEFVSATYTVSGETTGLNATLERLIDGKWTYYKSVAKVGTTNPYVYTNSSNPPKGYYYRLVVNISSTSIPGGTSYSNTIYY